MNATSPSAFPSIFWPRTKARFPGRLWVLTEVLLILSYTVKPSPYRPLLFFVPIAILVTYSLFFTRMTNLEHVGNNDWGMACRLMSILLFASTNILLCDVQRDLIPTKYVEMDGRHKKDDDEREGVPRRRNVSEESLLTRLKWAFGVWFNPRAVNFTDEPTAALPPRPANFTRFGFVAHQFRSSLLTMFLYDITAIVSRANPYFGFVAPSVVGYQRLWRLGGFLYGFLIYFLLKFQHQLASMIFVGLGLTRPEDWPGLFDSFKYAYTLRGLWGKTWHQMFRRATLLHARYFSQKLGIPPKSTLASLFTLYVVFAMSGILHHAGDAMVMQSITRPGAFQFFMLQAVGITLEDAFLRLVAAATTKGDSKASSKITKDNEPPARSKTQALPRWPVRLVGFAWVLLWVTFTLPVWTDGFCRAGFMRDIPQVSFILGVWRGEWAPEGWQPVRK